MAVLQRSLSSSSSYPSIIRGPQASQQTRSLAQTLRILLRNPVRSASWSYDILKLNKMFYKKLPCTFLTIKAPRTQEVIPIQVKVDFWWPYEWKTVRCWWYFETFMKIYGKFFSLLGYIMAKQNTVINFFYIIRLKNANIAWNTNKCWSGWQGTLP